MSDEKKEGFFSQIKTQIVAGVGIVLAGLGTAFVDEIKSFVGIEDESEVAAPAVNAEQNVNVQGPTINLNIPQAAPTRTIIKEVKAEPETVKVEKPKATDRLLKYKKKN